eukprot:TRINITY_DN28863_c0_g1_i1.p1 TRINITY_DN28863_c0_g1~~TRINITY_DN28863_c0_g1_i1.p1  ORF type:complete len:251 (+),score=78.03 TRINITY_DN28863_c0_g1_i1:234-986(+)
MRALLRTVGPALRAVSRSTIFIPPQSFPHVLVGWNPARQFAKKSKKSKKERAPSVVDHDEEDTNAEFNIDAMNAALEKSLQKAVEALQRKQGALRTGRASPSMLDSVSVTAYGESMSIQSVASTTVRGPQLVVVIPHDPTQAEAICAGIKESGLSLNPEVQPNKSIQIKIPKMSKEVRADMVKMVATSAEECKGRVRKVRQQAMTKLKKKVTSEDDKKRYEKQVQKMIDDCLEHVAEVSKQKEDEIAGEN